MKPVAKAVRIRSQNRIWNDAHHTEKEAKTFAKKALMENGGYRCVSFESKKGREGTGIVDLVGVRRNRTDRDSLDVILVQVKGGSARITATDLKRLHDATKKVQVSYTVAAKPARSVVFNPSPFNKE